MYRRQSQSHISTHFLIPQNLDIYRATAELSGLITIFDGLLHGMTSMLLAVKPFEFIRQIFPLLYPSMLQS